MLDRSEVAFLEALHRRGARRLHRVTFRRNRTNIWSLGGSGTVLNLHEGYRPAPPSILDAFALIVREAERDTPAFREAGADLAGSRPRAPRPAGLSRTLLRDA